MVRSVFSYSVFLAGLIIRVGWLCRRRQTVRSNRLISKIARYRVPQLLGALSLCSNDEQILKCAHFRLCPTQVDMGTCNFIFGFNHVIFL